MNGAAGYEDEARSRAEAAADQPTQAPPRITGNHHLIAQNQAKIIVDRPHPLS